MKDEGILNHVISHNLNTKWLIFLNDFFQQRYDNVW
jgi:hypothetical protein